MKPTATKVHSRNAWIWYFKYLSLEWGGWFEIFRPRCRTGNLNLNRNRNILRLRWSYPQLFSSAALHPLISSEIDEPQANWTEKKTSKLVDFKKYQQVIIFWKYPSKHQSITDNTCLPYVSKHVFPLFCYQALITSSSWSDIRKGYWVNLVLNFFLHFPAARIKSKM